MKSLLYILLVAARITQPEHYSTSAAEWQRIYYYSNLPDYEESTYWATKDGWNKRVLRDEARLKYRNPYQYMYDRAWDMDKIEGVGVQGERITKYEKHGVLFWTDHHIGTGSGNFSVTSMAGYVQGDRILVHDGIYTLFPCQITNMTGITILNEKFTTGVVALSNREFILANDIGCTFTGTGAVGITYGFSLSGSNTAVFELSNRVAQCVIDHIEAHDLTNGGNLLFENQNGIVLAYDGVNSNTKLFLQNNCSFFRMHKANAIMGNFRGPWGNVTDSCTFSHFTIDSSNSVSVFNNGNSFRDTFSYCIITPTLGAYNNDQGFFYSQGCVNFHHNLRTGPGWGWFVRAFMNSLNTPANMWIYSNIDQGHISYGFVDSRTDTVGAGQYYGGTPSLNNPRRQGVNLYIVNNTVGNYKNVNTYVTSIDVSYNMMLAGFKVYVVNNLRFHSNNSNDPGQNDTTNVYNFGAVGTQVVSSNKFFVNVLPGILTDTNSTWQPVTGSPIIGAGNPNFKSVAGTDYFGTTFNTNPPIGAVEFPTVPPPPQDCQCIPGKQQNNKIFTPAYYHYDIKDEKVYPKPDRSMAYTTA